MDEERLARIERELKELRETAEENNDLLREVRRLMRISFWGKLVLWLIILVLPFYLYSAFLAPFLSSTDFPTFEQMKAVLDAYQGIYGQE